MTPQQLSLVRATWKDAKRTWPVPWDWFEAEAEKQLAGAKPTGGPGVFLNDLLLKAGYVKAEQ